MNTCNVQSFQSIHRNGYESFLIGYCANTQTYIFKLADVSN